MFLVCKSKVKYLSRKVSLPSFVAIEFSLTDCVFSLEFFSLSFHFQFHVVIIFSVSSSTL